MQNDIEELSLDQIDQVSGARYGKWDYVILGAVTAINPIFGGAAQISYWYHRR